MSYPFSVGSSVAVTKTFTAEDVEAFSRLSGDCNPLHLDPAYAKNTRFKRCVVHGALVNSLFSQLLGTKLPGEGAIYCHQDSVFTYPVYVGDAITAFVEVAHIDKEKHRITLITKAENQDAKVVIEGKATVLYRMEG